VGSTVVDDFDDGWDMTARLVDGAWVERSPRRPEIEAQARREAALLPWLAPQLPLPVPVPRIVSEAPLVLRHAYLPGDPCPGTSPDHGRAVGGFLGALHAVDPEQALAHGARDAESSAAAARQIRERMAVDVLPRLSATVAEDAAALLGRLAAQATQPPEARLVHGDLGPSHIRVTGDEVTGIIDWGDSGIGDRAIDLAWTAYGAGPEFVGGLLRAYGPDPGLMARARDLHLLGPWHEVLFGLDTGQDEYVASGIAGAVQRLKRFGSGAS
jgi:aminoglycoside phosphotransferase (APT) family kinase protein